MRQEHCGLWISGVLTGIRWRRGGRLSSVVLDYSSHFQQGADAHTVGNLFGPRGLRYQEHLLCRAQGAMEAGAEE